MLIGPYWPEDDVNHLRLVYTIRYAERKAWFWKESGLLTLHNFVLPIDLMYNQKKGIKGLLNNRGWSQSLDWFPQCLSLSLSPFPSLCSLISGWIPIWGTEVCQVYLLALAVKTHAKGNLRRGTLRYSSEHRWPNVDGANSLSGILLVFRVIQVIQSSSST